jgi:hypothetical protein
MSVFSTIFRRLVHDPSVRRIYSYQLHQEIKLPDPLITPLGGRVRCVYCVVDIDYQIVDAEIRVRSINLSKKGAELGHLSVNLSASRTGFAWCADAAQRKYLNHVLPRIAGQIISREEHLRRVMFAKAGHFTPATEKQKAFAIKLGVQFYNDISKRRLGEKIEAYLEWKKSFRSSPGSHISQDRDEFCHASNGGYPTDVDERMGIPYASLPPGEPRPKASGLGIASLILGLISMLGAWVPCCGVGAWPVAIVGLILGFVGLLVVISNHSSRAPVGFPIAGIIVCLISICLPFVLPLLIVGTGSLLGPRTAVSQPATVATPAIQPFAAPLMQSTPPSLPVSAAIADAKTRLETAKEACIMKLKGTDAYIAAAADALVKQDRLKIAKQLGDSEDIAESSLACIKAKELVQKLEADACSRDPQVIAAQKELDSLSR